MLCAFVLTRSWLTWGCGCEMPSRPWRTMLYSWCLPWWSGQQRKTDTHWYTKTHTCYCVIFFFLKVLLSPLSELREIDVLFPGYTHMQRAQPIRWSHWILRWPFYEGKPTVHVSYIFFILDNVLFMSVSCFSFPARWLNQPSAMLLLWAEMWTGFRKSRKELVFYLSAGTLWTHTQGLTQISPSQTWPVKNNDSCRFQWCHRWNTIWHRQRAAAERSG